MKFIIEQQQLVEPLRKLAGVVPGGDLVSAMGSILIEPTDSGVKFTATDNSQRLEFQVQAEGTDLVPCTMPAAKMLQICAKFPSDAKIEFEVSEGDKSMAFRHGRSRYTVVTDDPDKFPSMASEDEETTLSLPERTLLALLSRVRYASSKNDMRYYLMGVLLDVREDRIIAAATDGHRMAVAEEELATGMAEPRQLILPNKGVDELANVLADRDEAVTLNLADNSLRLDLSGNRSGFQTILVDGKYPEYQAVIPTDRNASAAVGREALIAATERLAAVSDTKMKGVKLDFGDELTVSTENAAGDTGEEIFGLEQPLEVAISLNIAYLLETLRNMTGEQIMFSLKDGVSSVMITPPEDAPREKHIIMPLRT